MVRFTKKDAERCFKDLAETINKQAGNCWKKKGDKNVAKVGCWTLDCNSTYGGCVVEEIMNEAGGVTLPLGEERLSPNLFCRATNIAKRIIKIKEGG